MNIETVLPWQKSIWHTLNKQLSQDRLPHALLFLGNEGVGKKHFAKRLAQYVLCQSPCEEVSCGKCRSCQLIAAGTHPDFMNIQPSETGQMIKIDQIREVTQFVNETALLGGYRVIMIHPASAMNISSANALLKSLEEPTPKTLFILICTPSLRLPATIISRCQRIIFPNPPREIALAWLQQQTNSSLDSLTLLLNLTEGAPLKVLDYATNDALTVRNDLYQTLLQLSEQQADPLLVAAKWQENEASVILTLLLSWLSDLLRFKLTSVGDAIINVDYQAAICQLAVKLNQEQLLSYITHIQQVYTRILNSLNMNRQLLLEDLFIGWMKLCF